MVKCFTHSKWIDILHHTCLNAFYHPSFEGVIPKANVELQEVSPNKTVEPFAIEAAQTNEMMAPLHNPMPVIVEPKHYHCWLENKPVQRLSTNALSIGVVLGLTSISLKKTNGATRLRFAPLEKQFSKKIRLCENGAGPSAHRDRTIPRRHCSVQERQWEWRQFRRYQRVWSRWRQFRQNTGRRR